MKKNKAIGLVLFALSIAFAVVVSGCGGKTNTMIRKDADGTFRHEGTSYSLMPMPSPGEMAEANALFVSSRSQEGLMRAFEERMRKETAAFEATNKSSQDNGAGAALEKSSHNYVIVIQNPAKELYYVHHPEWGIDCPLAPSTGFAILELKTLPTSLIIKDRRKEIVYEAVPDKTKLVKKKKFLTRDDVDLLIRVKGYTKGSL